MPSSKALQHLICKLSNTYAMNDDRALLNLVFAENPTQKMVDDTLKVCDIEVLGGGKCLLLSYLIHDRQDLVLSDYAGPRIKSLLSFFRFANMKILAHFSKIGKELNKAGIPMLLFKGGAMKVLRPTLSRPMGDIDILIPKECFVKAVQLIEKLGYLHTNCDSLHAVDFHTENESAVDMHHAIFDPANDRSLFHKKLWERASPRRAFGVDFLLPSHEDLFFLVLCNFTKNLREHTSLGGLYYAACDSKFLMSDAKNFDWRIVQEDAIHSGREIELRFAADFINSIVPGLIPDADINIPFLRNVENFCNQIVFDEEFYLNFQQKCQNIRVVELKNHPYKYGKQILTFLLLKKLRRVPAFVRWYLQTRFNDGGKSAYS